MNRVNDLINCLSVVAKPKAIGLDVNNSIIEKLTVELDQAISLLAYDDRLIAIDKVMALDKRLGKMTPVRVKKSPVDTVLR